jgi:hypothetical protein
MKSSLYLILAALALATGSAHSGAPAPQAGSSPAPTAAAGCGRISVFDVAPRSRDLYRARLLEIDGVAAGPSTARSFRVSAGHHTLKVAELINNSEFNDVQLRQRGKGRDLTKTLDIDVAPDTTYQLAAHFIEERRASISDKSYWEPVIFQHTPERCR